MICEYRDGACVHCGYRPESMPFFRNCPSLLSGRKVHEIQLEKPKQPRGYGLGDIVAAGLSAIGITKERVSAAVGGDCGCAARQQALNEWGKKNLGIG